MDQLYQSHFVMLNSYFRELMIYWYFSHLESLLSILSKGPDSSVVSLSVNVIFHLTFGEVGAR